MKDLIEFMQKSFLLYFKPCRAPKCWSVINNPDKTSLLKLKHSKDRFESAAAMQALALYNIYERAL